MRVLSDWYACERQKHTGQRNGIWLPDQAQEVFSDATVLAAGPGKPGGRKMAARPGDRILCLPQDFEEYTQGGEQGKGFVSDRRLIGLLRAPHFDHVAPANDYLLIKAETPPAERVTASGVVVTSSSLYGDESRVKERAFSRLQDYGKLLASQAYREEPSDYYRLKREEDLLADLNEPEMAAFCELLEENRQKVSSTGIKGVLLDPRDYRTVSPLRMPRRVLTGQILGKGPDAFTFAALGEVVSWSYAFGSLVRIMIGDDLHILLKAEELDCVLERGVEVELSAVR